MSKQVPKFVDMTRRKPLGIDPMSASGAEHISRRIEDAWVSCGEIGVKCRLEMMPSFLYRGKPTYAVRSNLVNGLPPK